MNALSKNKGYRLNGKVDFWKDRLGKSNGRIISLIPLPHLGVGRHQVLVSNGDILTSQFFLDKEFLTKLNKKI